MIDSAGKESLNANRISINPSLRIRDEPQNSHNRWHESIPAAIEVSSGDTVVLETRDGFDGQVTQHLTAGGISSLSFLPNHPMTGPVRVRGAARGDVLEVEVVDIEPDPFDGYGFTLIAPGFGLLRDDFPDPFIAHWRLVGRDFAESDQVPGVRIPFAPFLGIMGVTPDQRLRLEATRREAELARQGADVMEPDEREAVPGGLVGREGLRTIPPRENGGNLDIRQLTPGSSVFLPVFVDGAMFSAGDAHFAQGEGETCGSAIEMRARVTLRFRLHRGDGDDSREAMPMFVTAPPGRRRASTSRQIGAVGLSVEDGQNYAEDLTVAARQAVKSLIRLLMRSGYSVEQAYVITSVAAELRVSQVVNVPNVGVSAIIDLDIFDDDGRRALMALSGARTYEDI